MLKHLTMRNVDESRNLLLLLQQTRDYCRSGTSAASVGLSCELRTFGRGWVSRLLLALEAGLYAQPEHASEVITGHVFRVRRGVG